MAKNKKVEVINIQDDDILRRPNDKPIDQEKRLINMAYNEAEKRFRDGTIADSTLNYFLKLGSEREKTERLILEKQAVLLETKAETMESNRNNEQIAKDAMEAIKSYGISN